MPRIEAALPFAVFERWVMEYPRRIGEDRIAAPVLLLLPKSPNRLHSSSYLIRLATVQISWKDRPRRSLAVGAASVALLVPCFWQTRIQAGDLSSHIYNAWLTLEVERGKVSGLWIAHQSTNIAFDYLLVRLLPAIGLVWAQRVAVSLCVLVFSWGVFAFLAAVARRWPWEFLLFIGPLAYGFVFHLGLFNFYVSAGVCFWFLAATWNRGFKRAVLATPLLLLAWLGNPIPVLWAAGVLMYQKLSARFRSGVWVFPVASLLLILILRLSLMHFYRAIWSPTQLFLVTGADQVFLYGRRYGTVMVLWLAIWLTMLKRLANDEGWRRIARNALAQLWMLTAAGVFLLPSGILFDPAKAALSFVPERLSLFCAVLFCALLAKMAVPWPGKVALAVVVVLFLGFLYDDSQKLNQLEDRVASAVMTLEPGQRVVFVPPSAATRLLPPFHVIDRACIGHCFSYGNYEPSSGHFRLRALPESRVVVTNYRDAQQIEFGNYTVKTQDLPLYQVIPDSAAQMEFRIIELRAGEQVR